MFGFPLPIVLLGIALGVSLLANAGLTSAYLGARDDKTTAVVERQSAMDSAKACSDGVLSLQAAATQRAADAAVERDAAVARAKAAETRAGRILNGPQKVPGNVCASAQAEVDEFFTERDSK